MDVLALNNKFRLILAAFGSGNLFVAPICHIISRTVGQEFFFGDEKELSSLRSQLIGMMK